MAGLKFSISLSGISEVYEVEEVNADEEVTTFSAEVLLFSLLELHLRHITCRVLKASVETRALPHIITLLILKRNVGLGYGVYFVSLDCVYLFLK
jgi:hypothetical protein